jgi:hypothetical protein
MPRTVILNSLKAITTKPEINPCIFFTPAWQLQATDFLDFPTCNPKFLAEMEFLPFSHYFFHGLLGVAWTRKEYCLCQKSAWSYATHFQHRCWEPWAVNSECISPCPLQRKKFFGRCVLDASVFWDAKWCGQTREKSRTKVGRHEAVSIWRNLLPRVIPNKKEIILIIHKDKFPAMLLLQLTL